MFTILLQALLTETHGQSVELCTSVDDWQNNPVQGIYDVARKAWVFQLETARYEGGFAFKFFIMPNRWQDDPNLQLRAASGPGDNAADVVQDGRVYPYVLAKLPWQDPALTRPPVELGRVQQKLFPNNVDPNFEFDVIVIGSGMAGGTVAPVVARQALMKMDLTAKADVPVVDAQQVSELIKRMDATFDV
ncbi:hypothetical protein [Blastopirellula retiformator]|uniref:Uncharacterized protein n=1 Tax=Blastopirellula retiformator TaxID=2527970 RepID=A0A5C5UZS7_9BACT|nr:hypothetical protein [Blastopirellula retiformator]TWT31711.1 hypothetical protein Enr8_36350 [Blastopirellula retiformator]